MANKKKKIDKKPLQVITPKGVNPFVRKYDAAKIDRLSNDWVSSSYAKNTAQTELNDLRGALTIIRNRARDAENNNPIARKFLQMVESNIVGQGANLIGNPDAKVSFEDWANQAEITGKYKWAELQRNVIRTVARDGECFVVIKRGKMYQDGIALQLIDAASIDEGINNPDKNIFLGIGLDANGKPREYHFADKLKTFVLPAADVIHIFKKERVNQTRNVSWLAPVFANLKILSDYIYAELIASKVSAAKMGFITVQPGEDYVGDGTEDGAILSDVAPGQLEILRNGQEFTAFDPQHPTGQFGSFISSVLHLISSGLGLSYENLSGDYSQTNYSSSRASSIEERENWICLQNFFASQFLDKVYSAWLETAEISGTITTAESIAYANPQWVLRRWKWVDPVSDATEKEKLLAMKLTSYSEIAAEMGKDYSSVLEQIRKDKETETETFADKNAVANTGGAVAEVKDTSLNGAQTTSLLEIISNVANGLLPIESGVAITQAAFPMMSAETIANIFNPLRGFEPKPEVSPGTAAPVETPVEPGTQPAPEPIKTDTEPAPEPETARAIEPAPEPILEDEGTGITVEPEAEPETEMEEPEMESEESEESSGSDEMESEINSDESSGSDELEDETNPIDIEEPKIENTTETDNNG